MLAILGDTASYETIRQWCLKFAPYFARTLKKKHGAHGNHWFLDEVFIKINGKPHYLWRAVDSDGSELDILITKRRNKYAATRSFKKLFKTQTQTTQKITTDRLASYRSALRDLGCKVQHSTAQYHNNIAEISHQKIRQQERQMRRFKSVGQAQRFLTCHGVINNHFRQPRSPRRFLRAFSRVRSANKQGIGSHTYQTRTAALPMPVKAKALANRSDVFWGGCAVEG